MVPIENVFTSPLIKNSGGGLNPYLKSKYPPNALSKAGKRSSFLDNIFTSLNFTSSGFVSAFTISSLSLIISLGSEAKISLAPISITSVLI